MEDKNKPNPLDDLFTDITSQIDPAELSTLLKPYVRINRESKQLIFTPAGFKLPANKKILLVILARKALLLLEVIDSELIAPKDIKEGLAGNIPVGTIDVTIKRLSDGGLLRKDQGKYFVPDFNFSRVIEIFKKEEK